jgi:hypothetical protein
MIGSASERAALRGVFGGEVMPPHHSIGEEEGGGITGVSSGIPSQFAILVHT